MAIPLFENKIIGRWTLLKKMTYSHWLCRCECGTVKNVDKKYLRNGMSRSCGCLARELFKKRFTTHGMSTSRIYCIWRGIRDRCRNPNWASYKHYGGRGITVCDKWLKFSGFMEDMASSYKDGLSVDRINNDGNYCKENCRWADAKTQARNTSRNRFLEFGGKRLTMAEWGEVTGIGQDNIEHRLNALGWSVEKALTQPLMIFKKV